jgi:hypothetical protein
MPDREELETRERAQRDAQEGKSASTQAGEFVREEIHHVRRGAHGARSTKQAIAIGLSKARRAGVPLKPPKKGKASSRVRQQAKRDVAKGKHRTAKVSTKRSRISRAALEREGHDAASRRALSQQAKAAARRRSPHSRAAAARRARSMKHR